MRANPKLGEGVIRSEVPVYQTRTVCLESLLGLRVSWGSVRLSVTFVFNVIADRAEGRGSVIMTDH